MITSTQNEKVKLVKVLQSSTRARRKERKIVLEGARLIRDAVENGQRLDFVLYEPKSVDYNLLAQVQEHSFALIDVDVNVMRHVSDTENPQGMIAVFPMPRPPLPQNPERVVILDQLSEPGNMGTLLRTSAAAGVQVAILSPGCVDPYNPKVLRSGMGAHFRIPLVEATWDEIRGYCSPLNTYLTSGQGDTAYDAVDWTKPWAVVIGSEATGVGEEAQKLTSQRVYIPMAAQTESLNAAVAAGIILFETARQNR